MKNSITGFYCFLILSVLLLNMTCEPIVDNNQGTDLQVECIDKSKIDPNRGCPRNFDPVCGCDGKTYSNECTAEANGVTRFEKGECPCVIESLKTPDAPCTKEFRPVCGCDGNTYSNPCLAKNAGLTKWTDGPCSEGEVLHPCIDKEKISKGPCMEIYQPVCGCNDKTYSNECEAKNAGLKSWTKGECSEKNCIDESKIDPKGNCTRIYKPVCGCDRKTYSNECEAEKAGVTRWTEGKCSEACIDESKIDPDGACTMIYKPVCGCDGKTYGNACMAEKAGVTKWTEGECAETCIDESKIDPDGVCTMIYKPVCGCDGKTYSNACMAEKAGVTTWTEGTCE